MKLRSALLVATVLAAPVVARAEAISGIYIGAGAGVNFLQQEKISKIAYPALGVVVDSAGRNSRNGSKATFSTGIATVASVGYGLGNGLRFEVEGSYRQNKFHAVSNTGYVADQRAGGDEQKYGAALNVLYDFDPNVLGLGFFPAAISPYVGVGAGYDWAQHHNTRISGTTGVFPGFPNGINSLYRTNSGEGSFAYQAIAGVAFPIASVPGLALTAEYRFHGLIEDRTYNYQYFATGPTAGGIATRARLTYADDYNHSIMVGVRYAFNAAAPAMVVPPVVEKRDAQRTYLVFFDWDRADLTDRARQIVAEAAQATTKVAVTRIEVSGHTDRSGTAQYNQGLSQRRASVVAAELVRLGVPRQAITTQAFGESRPLVPTADGVREPQNRRVEIVLK